MTNGPVEPNADMRVFASHIRQMFIALIQEGFTETQALIICGNVISAGMRNNKDD